MTDQTGDSLPSGIRVLAWTGDGPAPIERVLAACPPESDPEREGIRVLLASAWVCCPRADLAEFVALAVRLFPVLSEFDPSLIADVARQMGLGLEVA